MSPIWQQNLVPKFWWEIFPLEPYSKDINTIARTYEPKSPCYMIPTKIFTCFYYLATTHLLFSLFMASIVRTFCPRYCVLIFVVVCIYIYTLSFLFFSFLIILYLYIYIYICVCVRACVVVSFVRINIKSYIARA